MFLFCLCLCLLSLQLAVQFSVWDRIKDINSHTSVQLRNLAQFLVHLVTNGALPLSIIKIVEFGDLDKVTLRFVRQILLGVLLGKEEICKEVMWIKISEFFFSKINLIFFTF